MTPVDLERLDLRRDLYEVRRALVEDLAAGQDVGPLLTALGARDPVALGELLVGPQAARGAPAVRAALGVIGILEAKMAVNGLYRRLVDLGPDAGPEVLATAAARHPTAGWLGQLSSRVEGATAGETHLCAAASHPAFTALCWAYATGGHQRGLVLAAGRTGRPEPAAALFAAGALDAGAEAAVRTLEANARAPVLPWLAAAWGPDLDEALCRLLPHLRTAEVAEALWAGAEPFPKLRGRLAAIRRALPKAPVQGQE